MIDLEEHKDYPVELLLESLEEANEEIDRLRQREIKLLEDLIRKDKKVRELLKLVPLEKQEKVK